MLKNPLESPVKVDFSSILPVIFKVGTMITVYKKVGFFKVPLIGKCVIAKYRGDCNKVYGEGKVKAVCGNACGTGHHHVILTDGKTTFTGCKTVIKHITSKKEVEALSYNDLKVDDFIYDQNEIVIGIKE